MTAIKNALGKARAGMLKTLRAPVNGAAKLFKQARWRGREAIGKTRSGAGRIGGGLGKASAATRDRVGKASEATRARAGSIIEGPRARISGAVESAQARPRYAVAIMSAVLIGIAWIAWAIYVTASNGTTAGLGVLLTWPVLLGGLVLIAAPFALTAMLVRRHWPSGDGNPPIAGGANGQGSSEQAEMFTGGTYPG